MASCQRVQDYCSSLVFQCFGISTPKSRPSITSDRSPEVNQRKLYSRQNTQRKNQRKTPCTVGNIQKLGRNHPQNQFENPLEGDWSDYPNSAELWIWILKPATTSRPVASAKMILVLAQCLVCFHAENTMWLCMYIYIHIFKLNVVVQIYEDK